MTHCNRESRCHPRYCSCSGPSKPSLSSHPCRRKRRKEKKGRGFLVKVEQRLSPLLIDQIGRRLIVEIGRPLTKRESHLSSLYFASKKKKKKKRKDFDTYFAFNSLAKCKCSQLGANLDIKTLSEYSRFFSQIDERNRQDPLIERGVCLERVVCSMTLL